MPGYLEWLLRECLNVGGLIIALQLDDMITERDIAADLPRASLDAKGGIDRIAEGREVAL